MLGLVPASGVKRTGDIMTGGLRIEGEHPTTIDGYTGLINLVPGAAEDEAVGLIFKFPDSVGAAQDYAEANAWVVLSDADNFIATPVAILKVISATTNATPVAVTTSATHGLTTGDNVRITGTGIGTLDNLWWKVTVTSTTAFTLNESTAPGSTAAVGSMFTDRSSVLSRASNTGVGMTSLHVAPGLRGRSGEPLATQGIWLQMFNDAVGLIIDSPSTAVWAATPTANYITLRDTRASNAIRFAVNAAGQTVHDPGTAALPGLTFDGDTDSGIYHPAANAVAIATGGVVRLNVNNTGIYPAGVIGAADGTAGAPSVSLANDPDSGMYSGGADQLGFSTGGVVKLLLGATNLSILDTVNLTFSTVTGSQIGTVSTQKFAFHGSAPVARRAGAAQAAVATTGATNTTPYGFTTAAQADAIVTLVNELRAALVEKGLIKGAA